MNRTIIITGLTFIATIVVMLLVQEIVKPPLTTWSYANAVLLAFFLSGIIAMQYGRRRSRPTP